MQIIFTDLDGTLLNHEDYNYQAALPVIESLKSQQSPVIPVTSKTRKEVENLINSIGIQDPFSVENGSAIFIPKSCALCSLTSGKDIGDYTLIQLGITYTEARQGLKLIEQNIRKILGKHVTLQGFGDLSHREICDLTNLSIHDAEQAKDREFTEPFIPPENIEDLTLEAAAKMAGFKLLRGGRFYHILGPNAGKGHAVKWLVSQYQLMQPDVNITTFGLGDSPNDIEMLKAVDQPIIIPKQNGIHPKLANRDWTIAPSPAPEGWAQALNRLLANSQA